MSEEEKRKRNEDLRIFASTGVASPELQASNDAFFARNREAIRGALKMLGEHPYADKIRWSN